MCNFFSYAFRTMNLNEEQRSAVQNIVEAKTKPLPYLLFGPPGNIIIIICSNKIMFSVWIFYSSHSKGTGKTRTLVAAVQELVDQHFPSKILICAQSNAACDEVTARLLEILRPDQILRLYAKSVSIQSIPEKLKHISNIYQGQIELPTLEYIYQFRVVVCSLLMAGQLTLARDVRNNKFNPAHFSHIIIDEAASCQESVTLCAIAGNFYSICS